MSHQVAITVHFYSIVQHLKQHLVCMTVAGRVQVTTRWCTTQVSGVMTVMIMHDHDTCMHAYAQCQVIRCTQIQLQVTCKV